MRDPELCAQTATVAVATSPTKAHLQSYAISCQEALFEFHGPFWGHCLISRYQPLPSTCPLLYHCLLVSPGWTVSSERTNTTLFALYLYCNTMTVGPWVEWIFHLSTKSMFYQIVSEVNKFEKISMSSFQSNLLELHSKCKWFCPFASVNTEESFLFQPSVLLANSYSSFLSQLERCLFFFPGIFLSPPAHLIWNNF